MGEELPGATTSIARGRAAPRAGGRGARTGWVGVRYAQSAVVGCM